MSGAMYAGLSGVQAQQMRIDVISSNLANVGTIGYKEGRLTFQDALYQTISPAFPPQTGGGGGQAPVQIGSGVRVGAGDVLHSQGAFERTGQPLDLAIEGTGMFVVAYQGGTYYTRAGAFSVNAASGVISSGTGASLQGWTAAGGTVTATGPPGDLTIPLGSSAQGTVTSTLWAAGNLDAAAGVYAAGPPPSGGQAVISGEVYDSLGVGHTAVIEFQKSALSPIQWDWEATVGGVSVGTGTIEFDANGQYVVPGATPSISIALTNGAATPLDIDLDFTGMTQVGGGANVRVERQNGWSAGTVQAVVIDRDGYVFGRLTSGLDILLGQVALANFANVGGTGRVGQSMYESTPSSGAAQVGPPNSSSRGSVVSGALEVSNVDMTKQFVDLISSQQAFQASARVISASSQLMQEVLNLVQR